MFLFASLERAFMLPAWHQRWLSLGFTFLVSAASFGHISRAKYFYKGNGGSQTELEMWFSYGNIPEAPSSLHPLLASHAIHTNTLAFYCITASWMAFLPKREKMVRQHTGALTLCSDLRWCVFLFPLNCNLLEGMVLPSRFIYLFSLVPMNHSHPSINIYQQN